MSLQEVLSKLDQEARELFQRRFSPITDALQRNLENGDSRAESTMLLEQLKKAYVDIVTAQAKATKKPENQEYLRNLLIRAVIHQGPSTVFDGLQRAINVAYEGNSTSKARALKIFNEEINYLIEEKIV